MPLVYLLFLLAAAPLLSGCIAHGLPEYFSSQATARGSGASYLPVKPAIVVEPPHQPSSAEKEVLGHQYVFVALPLTSLYFEHGVSSLTQEMLIDSLHGLGYTVYTASETALPAVAARLKPVLAAQPRLERVSLNAYDAFFFRIAAAGGELELYCFPDTSRPELKTKCSSSKIEESQVRIYALGPALAALLEKALQQALKRALREVPEPPRKDDRLAPALYISLPSLGQDGAPALGGYLASSYQFSGLAPFSRHAIVRIIQRGMMRAAAEREMPAAAAVSANAYFPPGAWVLDSAVSVQRSGQQSHTFEIDAVFTLYEAGRERKKLIERRRCRSRAAAENRDGYAVAALESGAAAPAAMFLTGSDSCEVLR